MALCEECVKETIAFCKSLGEPFVDHDMDNEIDARRAELGILDEVTN